jgi:hypothetical protein
MSFKKILLLFLVWRGFDFLILYFAPKIIPYLGFFPYRDQLVSFHLPHWLNSLANFDGLHYLSIARQGYGQWEQAFFPLYPLLIKFLTPVLKNSLLVGLLISNVSFLLGLVVVFKLLNSKFQILNFKSNSNDKILNNKNIFWFFVFLLTFPTSFFLGAVYTEGLFFLLIVSSLYFLKKENYICAAVFTFLASLTRLIGVFLIIPIIFHIIKKYQISNIKNKKYILKIKYYLFVLIAPILGLVSYSVYLLKTTGDPFFFLTSQPIFGANRSSHLILLPQVYWRYFKIFFTANWDFRYFVSVLEFTIFSFVLIILILDLIKNLTPPKAGKNYDLIGLNLFSLSNLLLPTLTGTFSSIPRYVLFSLSFFVFLSQIKNTVVKNFILLIFLIFNIFLLGFFSQGYFVS